MFINVYILLHRIFFNMLFLTWARWWFKNIKHNRGLTCFQYYIKLDILYVQLYTFQSSKSNNLPSMKCSTNPEDLIHIYIWERTNWKHLERDGPFILTFGPTDCSVHDRPIRFVHYQLVTEQGFLLVQGTTLENLVDSLQLRVQVKLEVRSCGASQEIRKKRCSL